MFKKVVISNHSCTSRSGICTFYEPDHRMDVDRSFVEVMLYYTQELGNTSLKPQSTTT